MIVVWIGESRRIDRNELVYIVNFMRGREEKGVEFTSHGKVIERYDATDAEVEDALKAMRAYQTLRRYSFFENAHGEFRHIEY